MNLKGILTYLENTAAQPAVLSFISELPASPSDGDRYILDTGADEHSIAMYVTDEWVVYAPKRGWICFIVAEENRYEFDGTEWKVFEAGISEINWGDIEGTLSNQTDLQAALDDKLSKTANTEFEDDTGDLFGIGEGGEPIAVETESAPRFYRQNDTPDPGQAGLEDKWLKLINIKLYKIVLADDDTTKFWVEVTSPKIEDE